MFNPLLDKYDKNSANISIFPGVGGDDAKDWANILLNMYVKYAAKRKWKVIQVDDRSIDIKGEFAYGNLKKETGVHRLVRISPFDSKQLRHTSFALVEVLPEIPEIELKNLNIPPEDLKMETSRSGGPGGQNVNKRDTAVRVVHLPTGLAAASQVERSQAQNKEKALSLLKAKLFKIMVEKQENEIKNLRTQVKPEWGNQIRSYVLHPYQQVKDHRTGMVSHQPDKVLNGELEKFIEAELDTKTDA
jgi:peptide chain release factor 2